jgi:hypothetical protein
MSRMNEPSTCGKGLAERSALSAQLSALSAAIADNLQRHQRMLDLTDDNARKEEDAYDVLVNDYRNVASQLHAIANRMVGYRDLAMARHDARAFTAPEIREALAGLIEHEQELVALLNNWLEQDQVVLAQMPQ